MSAFSQKILLPLLILLLPSQLALHFWPVWSVIAGTRIDYLSPTIYLTDILILLIIASWPLGKNKHIHKTKISPASLFFLLYFCTNIILSFHPWLTSYKIMKFSLYFLFFKKLVSYGPVSITVISRFLPITILWTSILAIMQFVTKGHLGGIWYWLGERPLSISSPEIAKLNLGNLGLFIRPYATLPHPNALAGFILLSALTIFIIRAKASTLGYLLSCLIAILTYSRSVILALLAITVLFFKKWSVTLLVILPLSLLLTVKLSVKDSASYIERMVLIKHSLKVILNNPVFGTGLGTYPLYSVLNHQPVHNIFLLLISELGISAFLISAYFLTKKNILDIIIFDKMVLYSFVSLLITGMLDHYWLTQQQNILLITVFAALLKLKSENAG